MPRWPTAIVLSVLLAAEPSTRTSGRTRSPDQGASATIVVDAKHPWIDSGLTVRKGERLLFHADGMIRWGPKPDQVAGPEGHGARAGKVGAGGLIGRVGFNGKPFPIGNAHAPIAMPKSGRLLLGINDFVFGDNTGSFTVAISSMAR